MPPTDVDLEMCANLVPVAKSNQETLDSLLRGEVIVSPHPVVPMASGPIDWDADPFDRNWRYSFHTLRWLSPALWGMSQGGQRAQEFWVQTVRDWVVHSPTSIAEQRPQAWANMVDGIRALRLVQGAPYVHKYSPDDLGWLVDSLRDHMHWLANEANLGHSNHALHQHEALFTVASVLGNRELADLAVRRLEELFFQHWSEDGMNAEGAIAYHHINYLWWQQVVAVLERAGSGAGKEFRAVLNRAPINLAHATRPDKTFVPIGDTDTGRPTRVDHAVAKWVLTGGARGEPPTDNVLVHPDGYIFGRSGWGEFERDFAEETFFSVTFGRYKVHGHEDGGSLTYSAARVNWVVDPGKYSYSHETPIRKHMVAHDSHSLTYLEGRERKRSVPVSLMRSSIAEDTYDFTFSDPGYAEAVITRRVVYSISGEYLVVIDNVTSDQEVTAVQRWQLGPGVAVADEGLIMNLTSGHAKAQIRFFGLRPDVRVIHHDGEDPNGLVSVGWKQSAEAPVVEARRTSRSLRFVTFVVPNHGKGDVYVVPLKNLPSGVLAFDVDTGRTQEVVVVTPSAARVRPTGTSVERLLEETRQPVSVTQPNRHLQPALREDVFRSIRAARSAAWDRGAREAVSEWGEKLARLGRSLGPVDLGVGACLKDLAQGSAEERAQGPLRAALLNWDNREDWKPSSYRIPLVSHRNSLDATRIRASSAQVHTLDLGELVLAGAYVPGREPVLTVLFHGALDRSKASLPIFQRLTGQGKLGIGHSLILSDPTLDLSSTMRLGWYLGTERLDLHAAMARWITEWCAALDIERVVLQGSSGGGFAALQVGAFLPESLVIPLSPQTDTRQYLASTQRQVYEAVFGSTEAPTKMSDVVRLSADERFKSLGQCPRILYVQNSGDEMHVKRHAEPFVGALSSQRFGDRLTYRVADLGPGHKALDAEAYNALMLEVYGDMGFQAPRPGT